VLTGGTSATGGVAETGGGVIGDVVTGGVGLDIGGVTTGFFGIFAADAVSAFRPKNTTYRVKFKVRRIINSLQR
jgi:hypothetical protein